MAKSDEKEPRQPLKNVGISPGLADEVDRFIAKHPEFGITFRNEFANRAVDHFLRHLRHELYVKMTVEGGKTDGADGPLEELRRSGFKP